MSWCEVVKDTHHPSIYVHKCHVNTTLKVIFYWMNDSLFNRLRRAKRELNFPQRFHFLTVLFSLKTWSLTLTLIYWGKMVVLTPTRSPEGPGRAWRGAQTVLRTLCAASQGHLVALRWADTVRAGLFELDPHNVFLVCVLGQGQKRDGTPQIFFQFHSSITQVYLNSIGSDFQNMGIVAGKVILPSGYV